MMVEPNVSSIAVSLNSDERSYATTTSHPCLSQPPASSKLLLDLNCNVDGLMTVPQVLECPACFRRRCSLLGPEGLHDRLLFRTVALDRSVFQGTLIVWCSCSLLRWLDALVLMTVAPQDLLLFACYLLS